MMFPPVFEIASVAVPVQTALGTAPCRLYPFGEAPQGVAVPYAVWQVMPGSAPENYLGQVPDADSWMVQVDVYGVSAATVRAAALALRNAFEPRAHIVRWNGETKNPTTNRYRLSFDVNFITLR
jgi:hypothetical protein